MYTRQYLEAQLAVALGGRLAEELIYGADSVTTGAMNDIQQVANIAKRMVTQFGMSDTVGPLGIGEGGPVFMGRRMAEGVTEWSQSIKKEVDDGWSAWSRMPTTWPRTCCRRTWICCMRCPSG